VLRTKKEPDAVKHKIAKHTQASDQIARAAGIEAAPVTTPPPPNDQRVDQGAAHFDQAQGNATPIATTSTTQPANTGPSAIAGLRKRDPLDDRYASPTKAFKAAVERLTERGVKFEEVQLPFDPSDPASGTRRALRIAADDSTAIGRLALSLETRGLSKALLFAPEFLDDFNGALAMFWQEVGLFLNPTDLRDLLVGSFALHEITHAIVYRERDLDPAERADRPDLARVRRPDEWAVVGGYAVRYPAEELTAHARQMRAEALSARALLLRAGDQPLNERDTALFHALTERAVENASLASMFASDLGKQYARALVALDNGAFERDVDGTKGTLTFKLEEVTLTFFVTGSDDSVSAVRKQIEKAAAYAANEATSLAGFLAHADLLRESRDASQLLASKDALVLALNDARSHANR